MNEDVRTAACHCGQFTVECRGEPRWVTVCHCDDCQRRTGSAFNLGAVFEASSITLNGDYAVYQRRGELGLSLEFHFCPNCGSNVHWNYGELDVVAVGCFADPEFTAPTVSLYGKHRFQWLPHFEVTTAYLGNSEGERE